MPKRKDTPRPPDDQPTRPTRMSEVDAINAFLKKVVQIIAKSGNKEAEDFVRNNSAFGFTVNADSPLNQATSAKWTSAKPTSSRGAGTRKRLQKGKGIPPLPPPPHIDDWRIGKELANRINDFVNHYGYDKIMATPRLRDTYDNWLRVAGDDLLEWGRDYQLISPELQREIQNKMNRVDTIDNTRLVNNLDFSDMNQLPRQIYNDVRDYLKDVEAEPNIYRDAMGLKNQLYGGLNSAKNKIENTVTELFDPRKSPLPFITTGYALKELYDNADAMGGASKNRRMGRGTNPALYKHMDGKPQPLKYATPFKNKFSK